MLIKTSRYHVLYVRCTYMNFIMHQTSFQETRSYFICWSWMNFICFRLKAFRSSTTTLCWGYVKGISFFRRKKSFQERRFSMKSFVCLSVSQVWIKFPYLFILCILIILHVNMFKLLWWSFMHIYCTIMDGSDVKDGSFATYNPTR